MKLFLVMLGLLAGAYWFWPRQAVAQNCPGRLMSQEWTECRTAVLNASFVNPGESLACEAAAAQRYLLTQQIAQRTAVSPISAWHCPTSHPIKGNFTTYNGERCIFHSPGGQYYENPKAEKLCESCRRNRGWLPTIPQVKGKRKMEQYQNCKHGQKSHLPNGCGCAVLQSPNALLVFNSIMPRKEIMKQIEAPRLRQKTEFLSTGTSLLSIRRDSR